MPSKSKIVSNTSEILIRNPEKTRDDLTTVRLNLEGDIIIGTWDSYTEFFVCQEEWPEIVKAVETLFKTKGDSSEDA